MEPIIKLITPKDAKVLLTLRNKNNRKLSEYVVNGYAEQMSSGNWKTTGQGISFDKNGYLCDGQHRLAAIVKCGIPQEMLICSGVEPDAVYDRGRPRTTKDSLIMRRNVPENLCNNFVFSVARLYLSILNNSFLIKFSDFNIEDFIYSHIEELTEVISYFPGRKVKGFSATGLSVGFMFAIESEPLFTKEKRRSFANVFITGFPESEYDFPIIALKNSLIHMSSYCGTTRMIQTELRTEYAIKKYVTSSKTKINKLQSNHIYTVEK